MSDRIQHTEDMARRIADLLDRPRPGWDAPAPPDYPPRSLEWYHERARRRAAEREGLAPAARQVVDAAQAVIDAAPR